MKKKFVKRTAAGFTIVETMVAIFIVVILVQATTAFYSDIINTNNAMTGNLSSQMEVRKAFAAMSADIRSALPSSNGAYTIDTATSSYFAYYSDIDGDGLKEKIRYFLSGKILKIGIIKPTGNPLVYNVANEKISALINNVVNTPAKPIFSYYNSSYNGTSSPMTLPISIPAVRLIKINVFVNHNQKFPSAVLEFSTQISIRNLKDNM
jgi:type II secretory pathway component PulJ